MRIDKHFNELFSFLSEHLTHKILILAKAVDWYIRYFARKNNIPIAWVELSAYSDDGYIVPCLWVGVRIPNVKEMMKKWDDTVMYVWDLLGDIIRKIDIFFVRENKGATISKIPNKVVRGAEEKVG